MKKVIIGDCELYLGDCLERMKEIAAELLGANV